MVLILQDFLSLFCAILLLLILYVSFKICKAVRQREPVAIDLHDHELERRPEVIRNGQRRWRGESENHSVRIRRNFATEHDERQGWYSFLFVQFILNRNISFCWESLSVDLSYCTTPEKTPWTAMEF